ncbi:hypothetical protein PR202_ga12918 [Eleusine coracana subsp. coracana]|uniref:KIB1-4 beta-propeller domain-containing protein n=1 Tax=Eleusine coracana subsp. coracana TaxID=191504 RepID=A0AAV5CCX2_ELECO|nr:hypothetical protein PR202_ga12918 [Eleusine coracana subsp. coracana]
MAVSPVTSSVTATASLPDDLVRLAASRLLADDLLDYVHFRAVCTCWRSATVSPRGRGIVDPCFHPRRWMMLPEGDGLYPGHPKLHDNIRLVNLDTGAILRVRIPLLQDHCILDSLDGLLLLQRDHDTTVVLLHPFTGDILELPPLSTLLPLMDEDLCNFSSKKQLSYLRSVCTAGSFVDGAVTVMLAFPNLHRVAFATPQDQRWPMSTWMYGFSRPPISSRGKIYLADTFAYDRTSKIYQIDTPLPHGGELQPPKLMTTLTPDVLCSPLYFVQYDSEILVIGHTDDLYLSKLVVYKLSDLITRRYIPVSSIGDKAILIQERTLCISSKALPGVMGDTIVYTHPMEQYLVQYHLGSGTWLSAIASVFL